MTLTFHASAIEVPEKKTAETSSGFSEEPCDCFCATLLCLYLGHNQSETNFHRNLEGRIRGGGPSPIYIELLETTDICPKEAHDWE